MRESDAPPTPADTGQQDRAAAQVQPLVPRRPHECREPAEEARHQVTFAFPAPVTRVSACCGQADWQFMQ